MLQHSDHQLDQVGSVEALICFNDHVILINTTLLKNLYVFVWFGKYKDQSMTIIYKINK